MMRFLECCVLTALLSAFCAGCGSPSDPKTPANRAPTAVNPGPQTGLTGEWASLEISARDPDGDALSFAATGLPAGISMVSATGRISGVYTAAGTFAAAVTVSDGKESSRVEFAWVVTAPPNRPPTARAQTVFVDYGSAQAIALSGDDPDGDPLLFALLAGPASGVLTGTPPDVTYTPGPGFSGPTLSASPSGTGNTRAHRPRSRSWSVPRGSNRPTSSWCSWTTSGWTPRPRCTPA
jgi:hypothetical protein